MAANPLGLGLGSSGRVSMETNDNIGGENQLIIIGVQVGIPVLLVYIIIYGATIRAALQMISFSKGKQKRLAMTVVLMKIGIIIPLLTSYIDSFNYITYTTYFLSGLCINLLMKGKQQT